MRGLLLWTAAFAAAASTALAAEDPPLSGADVTPKVRRGGPTRFYPEVAQKAGVEGLAKTSCIVAANGDLTDCRILDETPMGCRFGEALVRLATSMRVPQRTKAGAPTSGRRYEMTLKFQLPDGQKARNTSCPP